jgi:benzoyl-CoA reductase/2-hydroxyglutaryl-CoA dehydratase subunit BcrC/BadD/HgdB
MTRTQAIAAHKAAGGRIAAVYPVRAPRGLLRGFGYLPVEVWGPPGADVVQGGVFIQSYVCSVARCGLAFALQGGLADTDLIVVPHACDALQGLGSLLMDFHRPAQPVWPLYLPRGEGDAALRFLAGELRAGAELLAAASGRRPSDDELLAAIEREEAADVALGALLAARTRLPLSNRAFMELARSREYLAAEHFETRVRDALARPGDPPEAGGVRVVLSGIVPEPMSLLDVLSDAGALVVADDMAAIGRRALPAGSSSDPLERSAQRMLGGPPCSTLSSPVADRAAWLCKVAADSGAEAVVFHVPRSCEPEQFYRPLLQRAVAAAGLRELSLEMEIDAPLPHQAVTRLEALLETT